VDAGLDGVEVGIFVLIVPKRSLDTRGNNLRWSPDHNNCIAPTRAPP
jgi:hypothetical protein